MRRPGFERMLRTFCQQRAGPLHAPGLLARAAVISASKVATLTHALNRPEERPLAAEALRMLIERLVLTPGNERGEMFAALPGERRTFPEETQRGHRKDH